MRMRKSFVAVSIAMVLAVAAPATVRSAEAQSRLPTDRLAYVEPGSYLAGDSASFDLAGEDGHYLLRFHGSPEVFVLHADHGPLGGRVLRYDSGETALHVAGWGGITLYTDSAPQGLPATRTGDAPALAPPAISLSDMKNAAADEAQHLAYAEHMQIRFQADWNALAANATARAFAFDALENAARGIARFVSVARRRDLFAGRVSSVEVAIGARPSLRLNGKTLAVAFNPAKGFAGRSSSRAIAHALGHLLSN